MTTQPTALRLADALANLRRWHELTDDDCDEAAAELRRLHELNQELVKALKNATDALEHWGSYAPYYFKEKWDFQGDIDVARAAIAKAEEQS